MFGPTLAVDAARVTEALGDVLPTSVPGWAIRPLLALSVLVVGWYLSGVIVRIAGRTVARRIGRPSVTRSVLRTIRGGVILATLAVIAAILEIGASEVLLSVTVISAVIAIVLAPLVGSLINGLFILADRPFEIGDMIEVTDEGHRGFVEDITIRYTKIFTLENTFIVIPNSVIHQRDVINYSAEDERTRVTVEFDVTYESDLERARRLAERAARGVDDVIAGGPDIRVGSARYPAAPTCQIIEYADSGVRLACTFWAKNPYKLRALESAVQERLWDRFDDAPVQFAYPHRHLVFDDTSGTARVNVDRSRRAVAAGGRQGESATEEGRTTVAEEPTDSEPIDADDPSDSSGTRDSKADGR